MTRAQQQTKALEELFTQALRPEGYRRDGRTWRRDLPELILIVHLQRSQWDDNFYLNIGAFVKAIRNEPWTIRDRTRPRAEEAHYRIRLEKLFADRPIEPPNKISKAVERMHHLLDVGMGGAGSVPRETELAAIIEMRLIPFLRRCKDEAGLRGAIVAVVRESFGATGVLRDHLKLPDGVLPPDA